MNPGAEYRSLDINKIIGTVENLERRIAERFPDSSLRKIAGELLVVARQSTARIEKIRKPKWLLRILLGLLTISFLIALGVAAASIHVAVTAPGLTDLAEGIEAGIGVIIYLGVGMAFILTLETRLKRRAALKAIHELRSLMHIIDMHQLTKEPEQLLNRGPRTVSSPPRILGAFELARYLDYCSELLSLASKVAGMHAESLDDAVVLEAVNDLESLAAGLSNKIWQKITILDLVHDNEGRAIEARLG